MFKNDPAFKGIKTLFTVHNLGFQGVFPKGTFEKTALSKECNSEKGILHKGSVNFMKSGLLYADMINTVSEAYAKEICSTKEVGLGLEDVLSKRKKDLYGIVNGIDDTVWHPEVDSKIAHKYSAKNLEHKLENKKALADNFNFEFKPEVPVLSMITRLYDNKGLDILEKAFPELMKMDIQLVLLGTGDKKYHKFLMSMASKYHTKFSCFIGFDDELAHLIEAGSDMFLMPSKFEPCGLNQMYSLVYGTVPIVRKTGGLADTVQKFNPKTKTGNGFVFEKYTAKDFLAEVKAAIKVYTSTPDVWKTIQLNGMKSDFSWMNSTKKYVDLYKKLAD
jgi:starch synthase